MTPLQHCSIVRSNHSVIRFIGNVTVAHNCHGKLQSIRQITKLHGKLPKLHGKLQKPHGKLQKLHGKLQNSTANYKNSTANYKNSTANYKNSTANYKNSAANYKNSTANYKNSTAALSAKADSTLPPLLPKLQRSTGSLGTKCTVALSLVSRTSHLNHSHISAQVDNAVMFCSKCGTEIYNTCGGTTRYCSQCGEGNVFYFVIYVFKLRVRKLDVNYSHMAYLVKPLK